MKRLIAIIIVAVIAASLSAREYHVATDGSDSADGSPSTPLKTISAAARLAQPGDTVTVHEGTYRERINPPRGGASDARRIVYRAAPGQKVVIKGSEVIQGWRKVRNDAWKVVVPNTFFGDFNPYDDAIAGDWFNPRGRVHHTGAVYLNEHWLIEAVSLEDVLMPVGAAASRYARDSQQYLLNVAWLRPAGSQNAKRTPADAFAAQHGVQTAPCSEGGQCIGWLDNGDWARYDKVDLGRGAERIEIRAASVTTGGTIEIRLDSPEGQLLGSCSVPNTGGWQSWSSFTANIEPTGGTKNICLLFKSPRTDGPRTPLWFAEVDDTSTTIWAQFPDVNPNESDVEINVRQTVFYPEKPGRNYITVRGFTMMHAATPWAPPTAEQIGLLGTHWSKGWIIEDNDIRYSTCVGVTLGKHGDQYDNTSANTATGYVKTIERAFEHGWYKENIGWHVVRNNQISHCEQAGLVGSLGAAFSTITDNDIHAIHIRRLFTGAEMAGIKLHAAIDTLISRNHIYRTTRGIWLDWMNQGSRVTRNLLHDNGPSEDLFMEVDHGPFMIDNNICLSPTSLLDVSQGGAYVHNLFAGRIVQHPELRRETPYHKPHSTELAGLLNISGGDNRFYNNIFTGPAGLAAYDNAARPMHVAGNVYLNGARPSEHDKNALVLEDFDPAWQLAQTAPAVRLEIRLDPAWAQTHKRSLVTTDLLGRAAVPDLPYVRPNHSPYRIDTDYFADERNAENPFPGPFAKPQKSRLNPTIWPNNPQ